MYLEDYKRWAAAELEDPALARELKEIAGDDEQIKDRFAVALKFGTAGLRGVLGAGTNRMNIYVVRQATQGLANWVKTQGGSQSVAISYDSRINSDVFAKTAACVLAANGIHVRIYDALMPVPALRTPNARSSLLHRMMVLYRTGKGIRCSAARRAVLQIFAAG